MTKHRGHKKLTVKGALRKQDGTTQRITMLPMPRLSFEFDPHKAAANLRKHHVSFAEAMTVFDDPFAQTFPDELHSEDEARFITLGLSSRHNLLFLSHLEEDSRIRLIGARPATAAEREAYEELKSRA